MFSGSYHSNTAEKQDEAEITGCNLSPGRKDKWSVSYDLDSGSSHPYPTKQDWGIPITALPCCPFLALKLISSSQVLFLPGSTSLFKQICHSLSYLQSATLPSPGFQLKPESGWL